jgi:hypothetical protein
MMTMRVSMSRHRTGPANECRATPSLSVIIVTDAVTKAFNTRLLILFTPTHLRSLRAEQTAAWTAEEVLRTDIRFLEKTPLPNTNLILKRRADYRPLNNVLFRL